MRLVALVAGLLLVGFTTAHAGWVVKDVPGTPNDVEAWAPGVFSVSTSQGAWLESDGGSRIQLLSTTMVGTHRTPAGCFFAFGNDGTVYRFPPCANPPSIPISMLRRVKATESGAAYGVGGVVGQTGLSQVSFSPALAGTVWGQGEEDILGRAETLGALRTGNAEEALIAFDRTEGVELAWFRNGNRQASYPWPDAGPAAQDILAIDLFPSEGSTTSALLGHVSGLYRGPLGTGVGMPFTKVELPGGDATVTAVDVNTGAGGVYGDGFGMATALQDGGVVLLRAVPANRPEEVGARWQVDTTLPPGLVAPRYLDCHGSEFCVIAQATADAGNLFVYANVNPPALSVDQSATVQAGTSRSLPLYVSDPDGDPITVTAEALGPPGALSVSVDTEADGGRSLTLMAGDTGCQDLDASVIVTASDGLAQHDQSRDVDVRVLHAPPEPPVISDANIRVQAGRSADITVTEPPPAGCGIARYDWLPETDGAPTLQGTDPRRRTFVAPPTVCDARGASYVYGVRSVDTTGVASPPGRFTVQVLPWGLPFEPFPADKAPVHLLAGEATLLTPEQFHACMSTPDAGFPGLETRWQLTQPAGGNLPQGIQLTTQDGQALTGTSAITPELRVATTGCLGADLTFSVQHFTRGSPSDGGPASSVRVIVDDGWMPPSSGTLVLGDLTSTPSGVSGDAGVADLNCLEQRMGLKARLRIESVDGTFSSTEEFPVPGPWWFSVGNLCVGGDFRISGELLDEGTSGGRSPLNVATPVQVTLPPGPVPLLDLDAHLVARCGEGARGTVEQRLPEGPCSTVSLSWDQDGGPLLSEPIFTGRVKDVETQEQDLMALIGESVVLRVRQTSMPENERYHSIPITAEPFVEVNRRTEKATGTEADLIGVTVELSNTTTCGVSQVDHVERLEGVDYIPGSARFNGAPVEHEVEGEELRVHGLVLEGNATGLLTYVVRPRLLGWSRFEGASSLRGVSISHPLEEEPPPAGCGCAGGGSGFAALGLAGLVAVLRRRRGR